MTVIWRVFVLACCLLSTNGAKSKEQISNEELEKIFGEPEPKQKDEPKSTNVTQELTDPDYWDDDSKFKVSTKEFDKFDWNLIKRIDEYTKDNVLLSPFNLKTALGILGEAASGNTRNEILNVLDFPSDRHALREKFASLLKSLSTPSPDYLVEVGSRMYVAKDVNPRQKFTVIAKESYKTEIKNLDFEKPKQAAAEVNAWVAQATKGHIENLVSEDDIEDATMMILATIYFKGKWRHQFPVNDTVPKNFYLNSVKQISLPMMHQKAKFYYSDSSTLEAKILRMPYLGNKFAMYIVLPHAVNGLSDLIKKIYAFNLRTELFLLREETVKVTLPKLKFDFQSHLVPILKELGIREAFGDEASLPGIARGQTLAARFHVSNVIQKAGIEVNEVGSTAYAATEISLVNKFGEDEDSEMDFLCDHPHLIFIEDESTRQILFIGTVRDPLKSMGIVSELPSTEKPTPVPVTTGSKIPTTGSKVPPASTGQGSQASPSPQGGNPITVNKPQSSVVTNNRFGTGDDTSVVYKPPIAKPPITRPIYNSFSDIQSPSTTFESNKTKPKPVYTSQDSQRRPIHSLPHAIAYPPTVNKMTTISNPQNQSGWWYYFTSDWVA